MNAATISTHSQPRQVLPWVEMPERERLSLTPGNIFTDLRKRKPTMLVLY